MRARHKRGRLVLMAAVALVAVGVGVAAYSTHRLRWLELQSVDVRFSVRGEQPVPRDVAVVAIDAKTFNDLNTQWPFRRTMHAKAIQVLKDAGAKVVVYDVQFTVPSRPPYQNDDLVLFNAARGAGNVVFGTSQIGAHGTTQILGGDKNVRAARALPASAQYDLDPNGVIRRIPYETDGLKTMPVVAYERAHGHAPSRAGFGDRGAWIDFAGPPHRLDTVSFSDLLAHHFPKNFFRGRTVVVGATASALQDVHPTSTSGSDEMSGPEIQANAIHTIEEGVPLRLAPDWVNVALIVLLGLVAPLPGLRLGALWSSAIALGGTALFLVGAQIAFNNGWIVAVTYPLATALLSTFGVVGVHYFTEVRERRRTRYAFARFVPAAVVDRVLEHADDGLRLGGEEVLGTVLFSDIRGFTTFSESHPAPEVIDILNDYLSEMTDAIMSHGGTLIGYLGDGIIAIFGAPLEQDDHADRALAAAMEMAGPRLERFNAGLPERGIKESFAIGIGMNSGLFMAGNVGSRERLEYTVIGDTVNAASRIEGLTKNSGYTIFLAETTRFMLLGAEPPLEYVDDFEIRGRQAHMKIWGVIPDERRAATPPAASEADPAKAESL